MDIPRQIESAIKENSLVIFAGAGMSKRFHFPDWKTFVRQIIEDIKNKDYESFLPVLEKGIMSPIEVLDKMDKYHNEIHSHIKSNFNVTPDKDLSLHKKFLTLSNQIVTTNFDNAFESASDNKIYPSNYSSSFNISEILKKNEPYILKLHGTFNEPENCVVFSKDYQNLYAKEQASIQKLKSIFTEKTILFVGFSFGDPDINLLFNNLDTLFDNNNRHFILSTSQEKDKDFEFLEKIELNNYEDDLVRFINQCLEIKNNVIPSSSENTLNQDNNRLTKAAFLYPEPIDVKLVPEINKIKSCFESLDIELLTGTLNLKTLNLVDDFDLLIIVSKTYKTKIYVEDDYLKSNLVSLQEICDNVPNYSIPIILITDACVDLIPNYSIANIGSYKTSDINRFVYKAMKNNNLDFYNDCFKLNFNDTVAISCQKGSAITKSLYGNSRELDIGKKCLHNVIGRIEEQSYISMKLLNIRKTDKFLNIKASGGLGKTTLVKKVSYELYNRGYFKNGVTFNSCESVTTFEDFEEILITGFKLTNILNFKDYLIDNFSYQKLDLLLILDNFETVRNVLNNDDFIKVIELLEFASDHASIVITSRETITQSGGSEDLFSLTPLTTDDAFALFESLYGQINESEIKILRTEILEDLLNNNPLAIKLVTTSRTTYSNIRHLKSQLEVSFFESTNEDYNLVYKDEADLNIERTKSLFQSINYSYITLKEKEKLAFEILNLLPDGISLSNFKKCFTKKSASNNITDRDLRTLRDKSLLEDYNGTLQLQPIIRRFAEYKFLKRPTEVIGKYCLDAYSFNCHTLKMLYLIEKKKSLSEALRYYNFHRNNLLNVLNYLPKIEVKEKGRVPEKKYLLNFIYDMEDYIVNVKTISQFQKKISSLINYFEDVKNANTLLSVINLNKTYYFKEFDRSYKLLSEIYSIEDIENREFDDEDYIVRRYKDIIGNVHSMEGHTLTRIKSYIKNDFTSHFLDNHFFYLGIVDNISRKKDGFYFFE
ncbi:SIR2 family protein, partial [Fulvivirga sp.]